MLNKGRVTPAGHQQVQAADCPRADTHVGHWGGGQRVPPASHLCPGRQKLSLCPRTLFWMDEPEVASWAASPGMSPPSSAMQGPMHPRKVSLDPNSLSSFLIAPPGSHTHREAPVTPDVGGSSDTAEHTGGGAGDGERDQGVQGPLADSAALPLTQARSHTLLAPTRA